jgi:hypothetical protein
VKSWINVRSAADPLAMPLSFGKDLVTSTPTDEPDAHEITGYLRGATTAKAILEGWCAAFVSGAPSACAAVRDER